MEQKAEKDEAPLVVLGVDLERRVVFMGFTEPVEFFAMTIETAQAFVEAMQKALQQLMDA